MDRFSTTLSTLPPLDLHSIRADSQRLRKAQACLDHLTSSGRWMHDAGVADVTTLETNDAMWKWRVPEAGECRLYDDLRTTEAARKLLAGHHIMIIGDLHARLHYAALVFLLNGTATPDDVAFGFPQHKGSCWNQIRLDVVAMDLAAGTTFPSEALVTCVGTVPTRHTAQPDDDAPARLQGMVGTRHVSRRHDTFAAR